MYDIILNIIYDIDSLTMIIWYDVSYMISWYHTLCDIIYTGPYRDCFHTRTYVVDRWVYTCTCMKFDQKYIAVDTSMFCYIID
jgi:hypothetical protein